jgi:signal transduction histidine kinase
MKLLSLARKEGNGAICDTDVIGKRHPVTVAEIFDNLEASMKRLKTQISTMDTGSQFTPTQIGVGSFIKNYISTHPRSEFQYVDLTNALATHDLPAINEESGNFEVSDNDFILRKGDDLYFINFPEEALTIILDNIISNACSHGFKDEGKDYYIRFILDVSGKDLTLVVSNNGEPLHKELDANGVFKYGNTTSNSLDGHFGIGGYEIWKLMKDFNGTAEIIIAPEQNFTVSYKLTFPLSNYVKHFKL